MLKVMSKMGISDVASYCGAQIFDALGLDHELVETAFPGTASATGGIGLAELEAEALARAEAAAAARPRLENPGYVKFRKGGEPHATNPDVVDALQQAVKTTTSRPRTRCARRCEQPNGNGYATFAALVNGREPIELRDLLELAAPARPVPLDEVEPAEEIVRRFSSGGMSLGALSPEAHEAIAEAFNNLGARSNSRRGRRGPGALPHRAQLEDQADRLGPLRRDRRVRGLRRGAADQDRAGLEARRGRPAAGPQGHGRDRAPAPHAARRGADLAAAAPRHLLDRGPRAADLRPAPGQPGGGRLGEARRRGGRRASSPRASRRRSPT